MTESPLDLEENQQRTVTRSFPPDRDQDRGLTSPAARAELNAPALPDLHELPGAIELESTFQASLLGDLRAHDGDAARATAQQFGLQTSQIFIDHHTEQLTDRSTYRVLRSRP